MTLCFGIGGIHASRVVLNGSSESEHHLLGLVELFFIFL